MQEGAYTKIGNTVRAYCALILAAGSSSANGQQLRITGLPFPLKNQANTYPVPTIYWNVIASGGADATLLAETNATTLIGYNQTATGLTQIAGTQAGTAFDVKFTLVYEAA